MVSKILEILQIANFLSIFYVMTIGLYEPKMFCRFENTNLKKWKKLG